MGEWPDESEVEDWLVTLSNAGRWGDDDDGGTLNLIDAAGRRRAASCVVDGTAFSLALDLHTTALPGDAHGAPSRHLVRGGQSTPPPTSESGRLTGFGQRYDACAEHIGLVFHGPNVTHLDALSHTVWDGRLHNDVSVSTVTPERGADRLAVTAASDGIVTRGVLIDTTSSELSPDEPIRGRDLDRMLDACGVEIQPGDALLLRTGYDRQRRLVGPAPTMAPRAGWHPDCLPWFRAQDVAMIGSDGFNESLPNPYTALTMPVHIVGQVAIGLWLLDNLDLERAAEHAASCGRWTFQLLVAPLRIPGGTGSPLNPIAVF